MRKLIRGLIQINLNLQFEKSNFVGGRFNFRKKTDCTELLGCEYVKNKVSKLFGCFSF